MASFEALMASDNFDSAFCLAADEFSIVSRFSAGARTVQVSAGQSVRDQIIAKVGPLAGNAWTRQGVLSLCAVPVPMSPRVDSF